MADKEESESTESTPADGTDRHTDPTDATAEPISDPVPDDEVDDEREPEPVGAGATSQRAGSAAAGRGGAAGTSRPQKKEQPTAKRDSVPDKPKRTGPITFVKESVAELRKVVYPTGPQLLNYFIVVLIFVLFIIAYVSLLDLGLGALIFRIFS